MKIAGIALTMAAIGLTGCSSLVSLHPFVGEQQAVFDPALAGAWGPAGEDEFYFIRQDGNGYAIRHVEGSHTTKFSAQLFKSGDLRILDLVADSEDPFQVQVHTPLRVWADGRTLRFATLDSAWLKDNAQKLLATENVGDRVLITAPGDAVLRFLIGYGASDQAYSKPAVLERLSAAW